MTAVALAAVLMSAPAAADMPDAMLAAVNAYREEHGLRPLEADPVLANAAQAHAENLAATATFSHEGPDGSTLAERVDRAGYLYRVIAENIAAGRRTAAETLAQWIDSEGHRRNLLLADVRQAGVGFVDARAEGLDTPYQTYWTMLFGTRRPSARSRVEPEMVPVPDP